MVEGNRKQTQMNWEEIERTLLTCDGVGKARKAEVLAQLKDRDKERAHLLAQARNLLSARVDDWIQGRRGMCAFGRERMEELENLVQRIRIHFINTEGKP